MSYAGGRALILSRLRTLSLYDSSNSANGNWNILARGKSDHYVVIRPGPFDNAFHTMAQSRTNWTTTLEVFRRYKDDITTLQSLEGDIQAIVDEFNASNRLGDTSDAVLDAMITSGEDVQEQMRRKIKWLMWPIQLSWSEENDVSINDG